MAAKPLAGRRLAQSAVAAKSMARNSDGVAMCSRPAYRKLFFKILEERSGTAEEWARASRACSECPLFSGCSWSVPPGVTGLSQMHRAHGR